MSAAPQRAEDQQDVDLCRSRQAANRNEEFLWQAVRQGSQGVFRAEHSECENEGHGAAQGSSAGRPAPSQEQAARAAEGEGVADARIHRADPSRV